MTIMITEQERKLLTAKGFIDVYFENCKVCNSYREAYEMCETVYFRIVGERKYADWSTFRVVIHRELNKNQSRATKIVNNVNILNK